MRLGAPVPDADTLEVERESTCRFPPSDLPLRDGGLGDGGRRHHRGMRCARKAGRGADGVLGRGGDGVFGVAVRVGGSTGAPDDAAVGIGLARRHVGRAHGFSRDHLRGPAIEGLEVDGAARALHVERARPRGRARVARGASRRRARAHRVHGQPEDDELDADASMARGSRAPSRALARGARGRLQASRGRRLARRRSGGRRACAILRRPTRAARPEERGATRSVRGARLTSASRQEASRSEALTHARGTSDVQSGPPPRSQPTRSNQVRGRASGHGSVSTNVTWSSAQPSKRHADE